MRKLSRIAIALVVLSAALAVIPGPTKRAFTPEAQAQIVPTPSLPPILPDPTQSEEPDPDPVPGDTDPTDPGEDPVDDPSGGDGSNDGSANGDGGKGGKKDNDRGGVPGGNAFVGNSLIAGSFSTDKLAAVASQMLALGVPRDQVISEVFPPFIIGGESAWTDTWGAPRFGPGPIVRTHEGQDVFCRYGDPILAPEDGTVSYSDGGLGGISARVHTSSSAYFYLTHLSATNASEIPAGSAVKAGDVVGFCGNSGNAITTPPHVHFGWYVNGEALNPMTKLVKWLKTAERNVLGKLGKHERRAIRQADANTTLRLFGDPFAPDLSSLSSSDESLLALSAQSPTTGALVFTGRVFQEALAQGLIPLEGFFSDTTVAEHGD